MYEYYNGQLKHFPYWIFFKIFGRPIKVIGFVVFSCRELEQVQNRLEMEYIIIIYNWEYSR